MRTSIRVPRSALTASGLVAVLAAAGLAVPAGAFADFQHTVSPGESLASVAAADGLSVSALAAANGLSPDSQLIAGTQLAIPPQGGSAVAAAAGPDTAALPPADSDGDGDGSAAVAPATSSSLSGGGYVVAPGDTLSAIAARSGLTVAQLAAQNGLSPNGILVAGTHLSVPGSGAGAPVSSAPVSSASVSSAPAVATAPGTGAQPSAQYVSPSDVGSIAASEGVPASLAEAIAYQESGFNNSEVSPTGATGVMQIEPGTWNYIGSDLAGPPPLQPGSATDNIRAGSLLLHSLLAQTGGNQAMAAAAYYQGLQSVQQNGVYADTQRYVDNVMALQGRFGGP